MAMLIREAYYVNVLLTVPSVYMYFCTTQHSYYNFYIVYIWYCLYIKSYYNL
jgi:hypothetical protein